ncbi:MAG: arginase family protein [Candidatus Woesearchaeota archaeon]
MKIITVPGPASEAILSELRKRQINEHGRAPVVEIVDDIKENFIMIGGSPETTEATFSTFNDNHPGAGILVFTAEPKPLKGMPAERMLFVGCRAWSRETHAVMKTRNIRQYPMHEIMQEGVNDVCDAVMAAAKDFPALYVSIDVSVLDPAFAPSDTAEPGGMTTRELLYFLRRLKLLKNLSAADIVGFKEGAAVLGAKLLSELL